MAQEKAAPISEFERFAAGELSPALWSADVLLRLLGSRLPKDEFLGLARPVFEGLRALESEVRRLKLEMRVSPWALGTHNTKAICGLAPGFHSHGEADKFCFETELDSLGDSLSIAAPLFEG